MSPRWTATKEERFWAKVTTSNPTACWFWTASEKGRGYGGFYVDGQMVYAHRVAYELEKGRIPAGLTIDHLCRNRRCVNPVHLEAVTHKDNVLRGVSFSAINARRVLCMHGHPLDLVRTTRNGRDCSTCKKRRNDTRPRKHPTRSAALLDALPSG